MGTFQHKFAVIFVDITDDTAIRHIFQLARTHDVPHTGIVPCIANNQGVIYTIPSGSKVGRETHIDAADRLHRFMLAVEKECRAECGSCYIDTGEAGERITPLSDLPEIGG